MESPPLSSGAPSTQAEFDFDGYGRRAAEEYRQSRPLYEAFANCVAMIVQRALLAVDTKVSNIDKRAKTLDSFARKAATPSELDPDRPKYSDPLTQIRDLAGVRIITFFPRTIDAVDQVIHSQFHVIEKIDKADVLKQEERFGYQSVHYLVSLRHDRTALPEYAGFVHLIAEIQVRTILQHAWAEIEHDIQYKSAETIPTSIRRRFMSLAGLLEIADREFQGIQDEDVQVRQEARTSVEEGRLGRVEITPDALRAYLDKKLGSDLRMSEFSYDLLARQLRQMGFTNFQQIDECLAAYDDDQISRILTGVRQGQITRFEYTMLAAMGENYIKRHPWNQYEWFVRNNRERILRLSQMGVSIGDFEPPHIEKRELGMESDNEATTIDW